MADWHTALMICGSAWRRREEISSLGWASLQDVWEHDLVGGEICWIISYAMRLLKVYRSRESFHYRRGAGSNGAVFRGGHPSEPRKPRSMWPRCLITWHAKTGTSSTNPIAKIHISFTRFMLALFSPIGD